MTPLGAIHALLGTLLIGVVAKATLVLLLAGGVTLLRRRASASERHLAWLVALASCLLLAALAPVVPTMAVRVPVAAGQPTAAAQPRRVEPQPPSALLGEAMVRSTDRPFMITAPRHAVVRPLSAVALSWLAAHRAALMFVAWLMGCVAVLLRCVLGHAMVAALVRRSVSVDAPHWATSLRAATADAGVQRHVGLLQCEQIAGPITAGFTHPVVVLPADADAWPSERRRVVLLHELAHVARHDYVAQIVGVLASAVFWFHPLVWLALDRLRAEAENAADDRVLTAGTPNLTYAAHLLDLARGEAAGHLPLAAAVGLLRSSHLEGRFRAMLDDARPHTAVSRRGTIVAAVLACGLVGPLAGVRTVAGEAPASAGGAGAAMAPLGRASIGTSTLAYHAAERRVPARQRPIGDHSSSLERPSRASADDVQPQQGIASGDSIRPEAAGPMIGEQVALAAADTVAVVAEMPPLRMMSMARRSARAPDRLTVSPEAEGVAHLPPYGLMRTAQTPIGCEQSAADSLAAHPLLDHYGRLRLNPLAGQPYKSAGSAISARIDVAQADEWGDPVRGTQLSFAPGATQVRLQPQCASGDRAPQ